MDVGVTECAVGELLLRMQARVVAYCACMRALVAIVVAGFDTCAHRPDLFAFSRVQGSSTVMLVWCMLFAMIDF